MSEPHAALQSPLSAVLPCSLPERYPSEPPELSEYRSDPSDEKQFLKLRRQFRETKDWQALAHLLLLHASSLESDETQRIKASDLCAQAFELLFERVKDAPAATYALAQAVRLRPENDRIVDRLRRLYAAQGAQRELVELLRWRLGVLPDSRAVAAQYVELGDLLQEEFSALADAARQYERALERDPTRADAAERLIVLYTGGGDWDRAIRALEQRLGQLDPEADRDRCAELHRQIAAIASNRQHQVPSAARHLQAALKLVPDDVLALEAFGALYLASGKAAEDGGAKSADIFYKAAELARRKSRPEQALALLRRCLGLRPDHPQASSLLERTLIESRDWIALDELYQEWLSHLSGAAAVPLLLRRAELLDEHLHRREDARQLFLEASAHQLPHEASWQRLLKFYTDAKDFYGLAEQLDRLCEQRASEVSTETLLLAAKIYRDELGLEERAAVYFYKVLEREPFNSLAFEGYKEHWRRKHNWSHLRDLILYQIEQAAGHPPGTTPLEDAAFADEFVELADICERRLGDIDGAVDTWQRMAALYPHDARPQKNIERIEKRTRMWDNMVKVQEAELAQTTDPIKRLDILKRLTQVYRDRQINPERAIELHHEILELSPEDIQATRTLTMLYDRAGDFEQVVSMLRDQYERSRSKTERTSLLRRMAEIWHHELDAPDEAIWACREILTAVPGDKEAHARLQQILEEQERWNDLFGVLEEELSKTPSPSAKTKIMLRMARLAQMQLGDLPRAIRVLEDLVAVRESDLEAIDRLIDLLERTDRFDDLAERLARTADASSTPPLRRIELRQRLGHLALTRLHDRTRAKASFEAILAVRPDHRGALEGLAKLYRQEQAWPELERTLATLQPLVSEAEALRTGLERAEILAERVQNPLGAARVLEDLQSHHPHADMRGLAETRLEYYDRAHDHRRMIVQAETILLAETSPAERRRLFALIKDTWLNALGHTHAALAAYARYVDEAPEDLEGLATLAELHVRAGDPGAALTTLQRRLDLAQDLALRTTTLERMAEIAESSAAKPKLAMDYLRQAIVLTPLDDPRFELARALADRTQQWDALLDIETVRADAQARAGDTDREIEICQDAANVALEHCEAPSVAFDWIRRAYFAALRTDRDRTSLGSSMRALAQGHGLWEALLEAREQELRLRDVASASDPVDLLLDAAQIAEQHLEQPERAVAFLQRAHAYQPEDAELAARLEDTAERYRLWDPIIALYEARLERADAPSYQLECYRRVARIFEEERAEPLTAFEWLRRAYRTLDPDHPTELKVAFDNLVELAERHALWPSLTEFHLERATRAAAQGDPAARIDALESAARLFAEPLEQPLAAIRVLRTGLHDDPAGEHIVPAIRRLAERIDTSLDRTLPRLGALSLLVILAQWSTLVDGDETLRLEIAAERARLREDRLDDPAGAMAEWLRVLRHDPQHPVAMAELSRLAESQALWPQLILWWSWRLHEVTSADERREAYDALAALYEGPLDRPEYALRARLCAWKLGGELPTVGWDPEDDTGGAHDLPAPHDQLWELARAAGDYTTPPVPHDPLLDPSVDAPELADLRRWARVGLDPEWIDTMPSPHDTGSVLSDLRLVPNPEELSVSDLSVAGGDEGTSVAELGESALTELDSSVVEPGAGEPGVDEVEELDDEELEELDAVERPMPPPPPRAIERGLIPVPRPARPALPPRPRVASAWEELGLSYAEFPATSSAAKAEVALVLAWMWEAGADASDRAFSALERALLFTPEHPVALFALRQLAEVHDAWPRLAQAYELLLSEAIVPEHAITLGMRVAALYEERAQLEPAEERYRGVLALVGNHRDALRALCRIYGAQDRFSDYAEVFAELLEAETDELEEDEVVARTQELTQLLADQLGRPSEAIERLTLLARRCPRRVEVHRELIDRLVHAEKWQPALEAMRVAAASVDDETFVIGNLEQAASIYETKLGLPDRAIAAWNEVLQRRPHPGALSKLQRLYTATGRHDAVLPILDQRLQDPTLDDEEREGLIVAKARALRETGTEGRSLIEALAALQRARPDNDELTDLLAAAHRQSGDRATSLAVKRTQWEQLSIDDPDRYRARTLDLVRAYLDGSAPDTVAALEILRHALDELPGDPELLQQRVALHRARGETAELARSLRSLPDRDARLEAADLYRSPLRDPQAAEDLYAAVLAESLESAASDADTEDGRRAAAALDGLIELRIESGDTDAALAFVDARLETDVPAIRAQLLTARGRLVFRTSGDVEEADRNFTAALEADPGFARAKLGRAQVLIEAQRASEAEQLLVEAVDHLGLSPRHIRELVEALLLLGRVLETTGRAGEAYRRLAAAARHDPDNLEIRAAIVRNRHAAGRHRDVITAADQLEQQLGAGAHPLPHEAFQISEILVFAAHTELQLDKIGPALERLRRAAELAPDNARALVPLVALHLERGDTLLAARHAERLAQLPALGSGLPSQQERQLQAALLLLEAANLEDDAAAPHDRPEDRRRRGLALLEESLRDRDSTSLPRTALEAAFRASARLDPHLALMALHAALDGEPEHPASADLLVEAVQVALAAGDPPAALRYADAARTLAPHSAAVILALVSVYEQSGQSDRVEDLVESFLDASAAQGASSIDARVELLRRLAELHRDTPSKALLSLRRMEALDPAAMTVDERASMAQLYDTLEPSHAGALENHQRLLEVAPTQARSLATMAEHWTRAGELARAYAAYTVLRLLDPEHARAAAFLADFREVGESSGAIDLDAFRPPPPPCQGMTAVLHTLWESGHMVLAEHLPRLEIAAEVRISPMGDEPLSKVWGEALKRFGQSKAALVDGHPLALDPVQLPDGNPNAGFFSVHCQYPPVIVAHARARDANADELRFALGRALTFTRGVSLFATGLRRSALAELLSATLLAFHPRHVRRKHHHRPDEPTVKLAQELARKLPMRAARQIGQLLRDHDDEPFASHEWRAWVRQTGNRFGLVWSGNIAAALGVLAPGFAPGRALAEHIEDDADLRALVAFAFSEVFVEARAQLGVSVAPLRRG